MKAPLIVLTFLLSVSCIKNVKYITSSHDYTLALNSLINNHYDTEGDHNVEYFLQDQNRMNIIAGPYQANIEDTNYVFLVQKRKMTGIADKCFLFYKSFSELERIFLATKVRVVDCDNVQELKVNVLDPRFPEFSELSSQGREILTLISENKWQRNQTFNLEYRIGENRYSSNSHAGENHFSEFTWQNELSFSFALDFDQIRIKTWADTATGNYPSDGHQRDLKVFEKRNPNGSYQFILWINNTAFVHADDQRPDFSFVNNSIMMATSIDEIFKTEGPGFVNDIPVYRPEVLNRGPIWTWPCDRDIRSFQYMVVTFDPNSPDLLSVELHMIDGEIETLNFDYELAD